MIKHKFLVVSSDDGILPIYMDGHANIANRTTNSEHSFIGKIATILSNRVSCIKIVEVVLVQQTERNNSGMR